MKRYFFSDIVSQIMPEWIQPKFINSIYIVYICENVTNPQGGFKEFIIIQTSDRLIVVWQNKKNEHKGRSLEVSRIDMDEY